MIGTIYLIILIYIFLGGLGIFFINKKKTREDARKNTIKTISYFIIIHTLFISIAILPETFFFIALLIVFAGFAEIVNLFGKKPRNTLFFIISILIYLFFAGSFACFSRMDKEMILFTFLILSIFDAFSQISGQLTGRRKLIPAVSPGKTVEGLIGGSFIALFSALLLKNLISFPAVHTMLLALAIIFFAFSGDIACSYYKRRFGVKDFSHWLPGQGGFLDRFDSFIAAGGFMGVLHLVSEIFNNFGFL